MNSYQHTPPRMAAVAVLLLLAAAAGVVAATPPAPAALASGVAGPAAACQVQADKTASPTQVAIDGEVQITLRLTATCPPAAGPGKADIVLAIDRSASQRDNGTWDDTVAAATAFAERVDYARHQVAVLTFSGAFLGLGPVTTLHQPLTADGAAVRSAVARLPEPPLLSGATNITAALQDSQKELAGTRHRADALPVIVLLSDGGHNAPTSRTPVEAAQEAKDAGTLVVSIGLAVDAAAADMLSQVASRPSLYFPAPTGADLEQILTELAGSVGGTGRLSAIDVIDYLSPDVAYIEGSAAPVPTETGPGMLRWRLTELPAEGWTARYIVRALRVGRVPTNKLAYADYIDADGSVGTRDFPVPVIDVREPTPGPTPSPVPTAVPWASTAHLPIAYKRYCKPARPFDVALVIDTSSSMWGAKLDAGRAAARAFIDLLEMPPSRVAVLAFNDRTTVVQDLTGDRVAAAAALDRLPQDEGSRLDRALGEATRILSAAGEGRQAVAILISDGRQVGGTPQDAQDAGAAARRAGVAVYAIGYGNDVDADLLVRIAGAPDRYFPAPTGVELLQVYRTIAGELPCRYAR